MRIGLLGAGGEGGEGDYHIVGRVLSFFSSRRNWDSSNPSPAGECVPPPVWGEESPNSDEGTYTVVFIYSFFVGITVQCPQGGKGERVGMQRVVL